MSNGSSADFAARYVRARWLLFALLIALAGVIVGKNFDDVFASREDPRILRRQRTIASIAQIVSAVEKYHTDCGQYPDAAEGLDVLAEAPRPGGKDRYLDKLPMDGWNRPFRYSVGKAGPRWVF